MSILARGKDYEELARRQDCLGDEDPLERVAEPIGQTITTKIHRQQPSVPQLDPVGVISVFVAEGPAVRGLQFINLNARRPEHRDGQEHHRKRADDAQATDLPLPTARGPARYCRVDHRHFVATLAQGVAGGKGRPPAGPTKAAGSPACNAKFSIPKP